MAQLEAEQLADMAQLKAKLEEYLAKPQDALDLSGLGIDVAGAKEVAAFLPKW
jgi:hypothetical protein